MSLKTKTNKSNNDRGWGALLYKRTVTNKYILLYKDHSLNQWLQLPLLERVARTRYSHELHVSPMNYLLITKKKGLFTVEKSSDHIWDH